MILEGIATTRNADGTCNVAPMGPIVDESMRTLLLRPFRTSTTFANLRRHGEGVFHVTDDVLLLAKAAIDRLSPAPPLVECPSVEVPRLVDTCRWYAFAVETIDDSSERTQIRARVVDQGRVRDYFGLNRAKHAVVEAAILATRIGLLPAEEILPQMEHLAVIVQKTAGAAEHEAFALLETYITGKLTAASR